MGTMEAPRDPPADFGAGLWAAALVNELPLSAVRDIRLHVLRETTLAAHAWSRRRSTRALMSRRGARDDADRSCASRGHCSIIANPDPCWWARARPASRAARGHDGDGVRAPRVLAFPHGCSRAGSQPVRRPALPGSEDRAASARWCVTQCHVGSSRSRRVERSPGEIFRSDSSRALEFSAGVGNRCWPRLRLLPAGNQRPHKAQSLRVAEASERLPTPPSTRSRTLPHTWAAESWAPAPAPSSRRSAEGRR